MQDWLKMSAADLGRAIEAGQIDPRALTDAFLDAIDAHPARDDIYARTTSERARTEALGAAKRAAANFRKGPLDGVPISWKDLYDTAGVGTEGGTRLLKGRIPEADCTVLQRATDAGTVCLGKTHTTELAFSGLGVNPMTGTPPNAIEPDRAPGGSSSGAAVSTKLGLAAAGIGSDTGGSVRIPAAWNDLVGLKTTAGLIPTDGVIALSRTYDTVGPLTRTVEDAAHLFAILADMDLPDWDGASLGDETFHVAETIVFDDADPEVAPAFEATLDALGKAGANITRGPVPEFQACFDTMSNVSPIVTSEAWAEWGAEIDAQPGTMWPPLETRFRQGEHADPAKDAQARAEMDAHHASLVARIAEHGLIVMPSSPIMPPNTQRLLDDHDYFTQRNLLALRNTRLGNLLVMSSITIPTANPMCGFMLFAPPHHEERLLRIGRAIEKALT
ncbi:MAG: amidase family protein [Pseudomonadota bacterium]